MVSRETGDVARTNGKAAKRFFNPRRRDVTMMKNEKFAAGVNRKDVLDGAEEIGLPLDEHIQNVIVPFLASAPK